MPTFPTPGPIAAIVQVAGARVRITAGDRTDTAVLVEPVDRTSRSDVTVAAKTKVDFTGGRLSVKTTVSGDKKGSVAITIDLPAGSGLVVYLAHSTVHADGPLGACELHMAKGRVELDRVDTLQANIAAGEVAVGHIAGRADIEGSVAAVRIGEAGGPVALSTSGGQIWIGRAGGDVTAKTGDGGIRIGRMTRGRAELANSSGDIEVGIGEGIAARVDADSTRGSVRNSVGSQEDGTVTVHARTRHGDIVVQPAASVTSTS